MERYDLDGDRAFTVLRRYSQDTNTKLRDVTQQLIDTRKLPGTEARRLNTEAAAGIRAAIELRRAVQRTPRSGVWYGELLPTVVVLTGA